VQTPAVAPALPLQLALSVCYGDVTPREAIAAIEAAEPAPPD